MTYRVMFCCNDERGNFAGRVEQIEIGDCEVRLVAPRPPVMRVVAAGVKVGRRVYECYDWAHQVGNVFWDSTSMRLSEAQRLCRDLLVAGWQVEEHAEDGPFAHLVGLHEQSVASGNAAARGVGG